jgi:hypothetical protein
MIELVCRYLSQDDAEVRYSVLDLLDQSTESMDLSRVEECVTVPDDVVTSAEFLRSIIDRSQLFFLDQARKKEILQQCLTAGSVKLWRGTGLAASACVGTAVWDGVAGLQNEIEFAYASWFSQGRKDVVPLEELMTAYSLIGGPGEGWTQRDNAVKRILAMDGITLGNKLEGDQYFRNAVLTLLGLYCSRGEESVCMDLRKGIESSILDAGSKGLAVGGDVVGSWWPDARKEYGEFSPVPAHEQSVEERVEKAMKRGIDY